MATIVTRDGTEIFYRDWSAGQPVLFAHGWPLNSDAWDAQMVFLGRQGYRVIAHDRRGHGRSGHTWEGHDMDTYADDLAELIEALDLHDLVLVAHSTGGGEVVRYVGRHGTDRLEKLVLISAVPPLLLKTDANPNGIPLQAFDGIRDGIYKDRSQFFRDFALMFFGYNRPGAKISQGVIDEFWLACMRGSLKGELDCIKAFSETDFNEDLKRVDVPTLLLHGDDDQIVPIALSSQRTVKQVKGATLKVYPGAAHGLAVTMRDELNKDLLEFIQAGPTRVSAPEEGAPALTH